MQVSFSIHPRIVKLLKDTKGDRTLSTHIRIQVMDGLLKNFPPKKKK